MSCLTLLQQLEVHGVRITQTSTVLTTLTALEKLVLLRARELPMKSPYQPQNPLPPGTHALRGLCKLRVTFNYQPVRPLALPALDSLQVDTASWSGEVCPARPQRVPDSTPMKKTLSAYLSNCHINAEQTALSQCCCGQSSVRFQLKTSLRPAWAARSPS